MLRLVYNMPKLIDLTGQTFGRLTVIERIPNKWTGGTRWLCQCKCGNTKDILARSLVSKKTTSCGCAYQTHGQSYTRLYRNWARMKYRCENPDDEEYHNYGGRGIKVCDEWHDFMVFYKWAIDNGYREGLEIDRKNNNGNYEPSNCRWTTRKVQANNMRRNIKIQHPDGRTLTRAQLSEETGIAYHVLKDRQIRIPNISYEELTKPVGVYEKTGKHKKIT